MNRDELHPVEALLLIGMALIWAAITAIRLMAVPLLALLLVAAGWRPSPSGSAPVEQEVPAQVPMIAMACSAEQVVLEAPPLATCTVAELRRIARSLGMPRSITRSGRKADLLAAIEAMPA